MKVFIGADHAGFKLKERLKPYLDRKGIEYKDLGAKTLEPGDDYVDYALLLAKKVAKTKGSRGILCCGTGTGMMIAANKVKGVRAATANDTYSAKMARKDNDSNVLGLRARQFSFEKNRRILSTWLRTPFSKAARMKRRIKKIEQYEKRGR